MKQLVNFKIHFRRNTAAPLPINNLVLGLAHSTVDNQSMFTLKSELVKVHGVQEKVAIDL